MKLGKLKFGLPVKNRQRFGYFKPIANVKRFNRNKAAAMNTFTDSSLVQHGKTILVVEDEADSREMTAFFLELEGFNVLEARDGREAVDLARIGGPDLVLTDLRMPGMDGVSAIKEIRGIAELKDVPVIAVSGYGDEGMELFLQIDELGSGYIGYLPKPLNIDTLLEQIKNLLFTDRILPADQTAAPQ